MDCIRIPIEEWVSSPLIKDYLSTPSEFREFIHTSPNIGGIKKMIDHRRSFDPHTRATLVSAIKDQYKSYGIPPTDQVYPNIDTLSANDTYTITTGHQLSLMLGPAFVFYKIMTVVRLVQHLREKMPEYNFVPIFWMASEDHDKEEIQSLWVKSKKLTWHTQQSGAVGHFVIEKQEIEAIITQLQTFLPRTHSQEKITAIREAYTKSETQAEAFFRVIHSFFGEYGVVIVDGDHRDLKALFSPVMKQELQEGFIKKNVEKTTEKLLVRGYKAQARPNDTSLFLLQEGARVRIDRNVENEKRFMLNDPQRTSISFSELEEILTHQPESLSPNALMRPLYQETILPNLAYVGGGGEIAYWLQLRDTFAHIGYTMPALLLRDSVFVIKKKQAKHLRTYISEKEWLGSYKNWENKIIDEYGKKIDFDTFRGELDKVYTKLHTYILEIEPSFGRTVMSHLQRHEKSLHQIEKRWRRTQRNRLMFILNSLRKTHERIQPGGVWQERRESFFTYWDECPALDQKIMEHIQPFSPSILMYSI